jgi:hypothetical protein
MRKLNLPVILLISILILTSCASILEGSDNAGTENTPSGGKGQSAVQDGKGELDFEWRSQSYKTLDMSKGSVTISKSGIYEITGILSDGGLVVDVDKARDKGTIYLVLNNASISSTKTAPIYVMDAKKVVLILEEGTTNTIFQGSDIQINHEDEPSAAIFSKADLIITGSGALKVTSQYNDGITSKDTLKIENGTLVIDAKADGIVGKDSLTIEKAKISITAGKDGLRSTNNADPDKGNITIVDGSINITANNDAIQAYGMLQIDGGAFSLVSGEGAGQSGLQAIGQGPGNSKASGRKTPGQSNTDTESKKGLKATGSILINGGTFTVLAHDDAIHSDSDIIINGGALTLLTNDDGIHSDAEVSIHGGTIDIQQSYEGIEGKNITITNGTIRLTAEDDGLNVNDTSGVLSISGGETYLNVSGDGIDSNDAITMTGGTLYIDGPTDDGNGAIDYDRRFSISGGILIASGSSGMALAPDTSSTQPSILMYYSSKQKAGTAIAVKDSSGNLIASFTPSKKYSSVAISAPGLKTGNSYTLYQNDTELVTFTLSDTVTYLNEKGVTTKPNFGPKGGKKGGPGR